MTYKGLKDAASAIVPRPIRHVRKHHSLAFQNLFANTDIYKRNFFPNTIRDRIFYQILSFLLLKEQKILLLSLFLLWGLWTNCPGFSENPWTVVTVVKVGEMLSDEL